MLEFPESNRRALLRAAGGTFAAAAAAAAVPMVAGMAPSPAYAVVVSGLPWVGPAGSGAPFEVDPAVGAQQAINDALAAVGQGAVFVAGGTYPVKGPIVLGDRQSLVGAGPLSTLLKAAPGFAGSALVQTPSGTFTGSRVSVRDIGLDAAKLAANGINLQISAKPTTYGPDPAPWLSRVFVAQTTGDGIFLGGAYSGGQREFKVTDCRVENAGGWAYHLDSSDGFVSGCSAQGGTLGGYHLAGGNIKVWGSKVYGSGSGATPGPGFRVGTRATVVGCEAQDTRGCGFEIVGRGATVSGCTADSTGVGDPGTDRYSAGFYVGSSAVSVDGNAYQRAGGGGSWIPAKGMMWALYLASGVDYVMARVVGDPNRPAPFVGGVSGTVGAKSSVTVLV
ncbi:glycosyl hydrolase family 28-related protein [Micromonospora sp. NPDC049559]|uniref:right-handed parallel beta-helix repeat-containing protein n=1 Tax=Micromonospora sp. NPDC049559 TaxID=3155923 RepID=UPI003421354B